MSTKIRVERKLLRNEGNTLENDALLLYLIVYLPDIEVPSVIIEINVKAVNRNKSSVRFILKSCGYYI